MMMIYCKYFYIYICYMDACITRKVGYFSSGFKTSGLPYSRGYVGIYVTVMEGCIMPEKNVHEIDD